MLKEQVVLAFVAYHISAGRYGVKNAVGDRVGDFIGTKEEAQAEAGRLIAELEASAKSVIVFGGGDTGLVPLNEQQLRGYAADIDVAGHDSLPIEELAALVMTKVSAAKSTDSFPPAGGDPAGNGPGETTGQEAHLIQAGAVVELTDMPEEQLRNLAMTLGIKGHESLPVEQLVELIQAEAVRVPVAAYIVNRERLDHDGESYSFGDQVVIEDAEKAKALIALGAILERE